MRPRRACGREKGARACVRAWIRLCVLFSLEYGSRTLEAVRSGSRESFRFSRTWVEGILLLLVLLLLLFRPLLPPPRPSRRLLFFFFFFDVCPWKVACTGLLHGFWHLLVTARPIRATLRGTRGTKGSLFVQSNTENSRIPGRTMMMWYRRDCFNYCENSFTRRAVNTLSRVKMYLKTHP